MEEEQPTSQLQTTGHGNGHFDDPRVLLPIAGSVLITEAIGIGFGAGDDGLLFLLSPLGGLVFFGILLVLGTIGYWLGTQ